MTVLRKVQDYIADFVSPPTDRGARDAVALFSLAAVIVRLLNRFGLIDAPGLAVNLLPDLLYGGLMLFAGVGLLVTRSACHRASWRGQAIAALAGGLWLLLALDVFPRSLASGLNALIIAGMATNEVRVHGPNC